MVAVETSVDVNNILWILYDCLWQKIRHLQKCWPVRIQVPLWAKMFQLKLEMDCQLKSDELLANYFSFLLIFFHSAFLQGGQENNDILWLSLCSSSLEGINKFNYWLRDRPLTMEARGLKFRAKSVFFYIAIPLSRIRRFPLFGSIEIGWSPHRSFGKKQDTLFTMWIYARPIINVNNVSLSLSVYHKE